MKPVPSLPALFLKTIKKQPPQPESFDTPRRNSNFVLRDFMNHEENHRENHSDFPWRKSKIFIEKIKIFIEKIIPSQKIIQIFLRNCPNRC